MKPGLSAPKFRGNLSRLGTPDEIAHAVAFLLSEGSSYLAGTQLIADGGYTAR